MERNVGGPSNKLQHVIIGECLGIPVTKPEIVVLVGSCCDCHDSTEVPNAWAHYVPI